MSETFKPGDEVRVTFDAQVRAVGPTLLDVDCNGITHTVKISEATRLHIEGSSVPEATRAAEDARFNRWIEARHGGTMHCVALADAEVAAAVAEERAAVEQWKDRAFEGQQKRSDLITRLAASERALAEERATTGRRIEAVLALCQDANGYTTHDQIEKLGEPPWHGMDANLVAWERAHGHDVRLSCDRTDCLLLIDPEDLRAALASPGEGE